MSGYCDFSMSNNAVWAYEEAGEKPWTVWNKKSLLGTIAAFEVWDEFSEEIKQKIKKMPLALLKETFLTSRGWHHTASYYNETDFYGVDEEVFDKIKNEPDFLDNCLAKYREELEEKKEEKKEQELKKEMIHYCKYNIWSGSRNYPTCTTYLNFGRINKNTFTSFDNDVKRVNSNGFVDIYTYSLEDSKKLLSVQKREGKNFMFYCLVKITKADEKTGDKKIEYKFGKRFTNKLVIGQGKKTIVVAVEEDGERSWAPLQTHFELEDGVAWAFDPFLKKTDYKNKLTAYKNALAAHAKKLAEEEQNAETSR